MKALGTWSAIALINYAALGAIFFFLSMAGFAGDTLMIVTALLAIGLWGTFVGFSIPAILRAFRVIGGQTAEADKLVKNMRMLSLWMFIGSLITAFLFAFGAFATCAFLWIKNLYHWGGLVGSVLSYLGLWVLLPLLEKGIQREGATGPKLLPNILVPSITYGVWLLLWLIMYGIMGGSVDEGKYIARDTSPYKLPWPQGMSSWVVQGNKGGISHSDDLAWDFVLQCGTPVLASRDGEVIDVIDTNDGAFGTVDNNKVIVKHSDNTRAYYGHILKGSATVAKGDTVQQGQELAEVGNVGNSMTGHIHFEIRDASGTDQPISFNDVSDDKGIPRGFSTYESGNAKK